MLMHGRFLVTGFVISIFILSIFSSISFNNQPKVLQNEDLRFETFLYEEYYHGIEEYQGEQLHEGIYNIIRNHTVVSYSSVWDHLRDIDQDPMNSANVTLFTCKGLNLRTILVVMVMIVLANHGIGNMCGQNLMGILELV